MTHVASIMEAVFVGACLIGVGAWAYAARYWFCDWKGDRGREFNRKFAFGTGIFFLALATALVAGIVAEA